MIQVGLLAGRQAGKTYCGLTEIIKDAIRWPGRSSAVVSRDYKASREPEEAFRSMLNPAWGVVEVKADRIYRFPHGHTVVFRSKEAIDSIRGPSLKTILLDEFALYSWADYMTAVGCGAASKDFRLLFATTPRREVIWFRELVDKWKGRDKSRIFVLRTFDNPRRNNDVIEEIKANTPYDLYMQEFEGLMVAPRLATYYLYSPEIHLQKAPDTGDVTREFTRINYGEECDYVAGWDFIREAVVIGKIFRDAHELSIGRRKTIVKTEYLYIIGEMIDDNMTTEHVAMKVVNKWGRSIAIICDAMGAYERCLGRGTDDEAAPVSILRNAGFKCVEPVARANPRIENRVRHVLRLLHSVKTYPWCPDGEVRLFVDPSKCPRLKDALGNHKRDEKTMKPEKDGYHEHVLDALGYLIFSAFPIEEEDDEDYDEDERISEVR